MENQNPKPAYYAIIPANVRYTDIPDGSKLLYGEITALCNKKGMCWASNEYFAELYNVSVKTISRWIGFLLDRGFIKCTNPNSRMREIFLADDLDKNVPVNKSDVDKNVPVNLDKNVPHNNTRVNNTAIAKAIGGQSPRDRRNPFVQTLWEHGVKNGFSTVKQNLQRYAIHRLLKNKTPEQLKKAVEYSQKIRQEPYAPQINHFLDLEEKFLKLRDFGIRQLNDPNKAKIWKTTA